MTGLAMFLGGFLRAAMYHQARRFAELVTEAISSWWAG